MTQTPNLLIIDAIGPFLRHYKKKRGNWSKVPFSDLETEDGLRSRCVRTIPLDFRKFVQAARRVGYNAITLDDVAHLIIDPQYAPALQTKLAAYRALFRDLFQIATDEGMRIFLTTDVMFYNDTLSRQLGSSRRNATLWLKRGLEQLFQDFPEIAGVIMRFGETDGLDVRGEFRSRLLLKRPRHARDFLSELLPLFERTQRLLIFRTWSVGAHPIGDLTWNARTFKRVFAKLTSPALVISMKYGESDFFRYLPLSRQFFASGHQKVIEFQARREYEGFGAYPSFVGWDAEQHLRELAAAENVVGASVWCQTGGWGKRRQLTYIRNSSPWVELNAFVLAKLMQGATCEGAIDAYLAAELPHVPPDAMHSFLRSADIVIKELLYVREFAERRLFFRRLRLPPQLFVFWDRVIVDHPMKKMMSCLIQEPDAALREGRAALQRLREMIQLAECHGVPTSGLEFQWATFEIIAEAREYFFRPYDPQVAERLQRLKTEYKRRFSRNYSIMLNFNEAPVRKVHLRWLLALMLRDRSRYRLLDEVVTIRVLAWAYPIASRFLRKVGPKFAHKQAMGLDALFK